MLYKSRNDSSTEFKLDENYPTAECSTRYMFKVLRSNIKIAITPPCIVWYRSNLVQSFNTSQAIHYKYL